MPVSSICFWSSSYDFVAVSVVNFARSVIIFFSSSASWSIFFVVSSSCFWISFALATAISVSFFDKFSISVFLFLSISNILLAFFSFSFCVLDNQSICWSARSFMSFFCSSNAFFCSSTSFFDHHHPPHQPHHHQDTGATGICFAAVFLNTFKSF